MNRTWASTLCLVSALAFAHDAAQPAQSHARSFRCGNDLVSVGEQKASVQLKCGEPFARDRLCQRGPPDAYGRAAPCLDVELWTYRPGYGQYITTLRFEDGTLVDIAYGDRVP